jgi:hypothetical protein
VKTGRIWVLGLVALGSCAAVFAVWHWSRPENAVRWTFTQFHMSLLRKRLDPVRQIAAETVISDGQRQSREDFIAGYVVPATQGPLTVAPCPASPGHWDALMNERAWCFAPLKRGWALHRVGKAPCDDR